MYIYIFPLSCFLIVFLFLYRYIEIYAIIIQVVKPIKLQVKSKAIKETPPADVVRLCQETMAKTAEYLRGELEGTAEEYKLLEQMNQVTINKYSEMKHIAMNISRAMVELDDKYRSLQPYLDQIDQIEESVSNLEQAAYRLDAYSKRLESKFKTLQKR